MVIIQRLRKSVAVKGKTVVASVPSRLALQTWPQSLYDPAMSALDLPSPMPVLTRRQAYSADWAPASSRGLARSRPGPARAAAPGQCGGGVPPCAGPGTFDPPGFLLGQCIHAAQPQRRRARAGQALANGSPARACARRGCAPAWCRCMDTATLAFGTAQAWTALGSPTGLQIDARPSSCANCKRRWCRRPGRSGSFEVWVTHMFVIADLTGANTDSGDGVLIARAPADCRPVLAPLDLT